MQRKYRVVLLSIVLITAGFVATMHPALAVNYGVFVTAILSAAGLYGGMNITNKHVLAKHGILPKEEIT